MKDFKCKLTHDEIEGIKTMLEGLMKRVSPKRTPEKLVYAEIENLQTRLYKKATPWDMKTLYKLTLPAPEALALEIFCRTFPSMDFTTYEGIAVLSLINEINKHYA